jgi:hypothetical protein
LQRQRETWLESTCAALLGRVPKLFAYPLVPLMVATLITFTGTGELELKSAGLVIVAVWFSLDVWRWLFTKRVSKGQSRVWDSSKVAIGWCATSLTLLATMFIMQWMLGSKLNEMTADSQQNIVASVALPVSGNPRDSLFTYRNNGKQNIVAFKIGCILNYMVIGTVAFDRSYFDSQPSTTPLQAGGDTVTDQCFQQLAGASMGDMRCADVTVWFIYAVDSSPATLTKPFRFVLYKVGPQYQWVNSQIADNRIFCSASS